MKNKKGIFKKVILCVPVLLIAAFVIWGVNSYKAMPTAVTSMKNEGEITVENKPWLEFTPTKTTDIGFIIYPGAKVEPTAYAPLAKSIAYKGYKVVIVPMPLNFAIFSPSEATKVMKQYPEIKNWAIGGHSLGGVMAAKYAFDHSDKIKGLALLASYPQNSNDLSKKGIKVVSIYGTRDGFVTKDKIDNSKKLLPHTTTWVPIEGGNHSQFGYYGFQSGDNKAEITREEQQGIISDSVVKMLETLK